MKSDEITLINLTIAELKDIVKTAVQEELKEIFEPASEDIDKLISRKEVAKFLKVSLPTLTKYVKNGTIPAHRIGNRILFKKQEVIDSLHNVHRPEFQFKH
ncbi:helix-turn-helix domain-containing protein [Ekhidna sp.]|uniref:helix-turn-helix domain-containing protein n=1 Tax=Ekhidna sp. TaxID=2608089 RepID=UPI00329A7535